MHALSRATCGAVLAALALVGAAEAVTVDQVWSSWRDAAQRNGLTLDATTEITEPGFLLLSNLRLTRHGTGQISAVTLRSLTLREGPPGIVTISLSGEVGYSSPWYARPSFLISHDKAILTVTEADGGLAYHLSADRIGLAGATPPEGAIAPNRPVQLKAEFSDLDLRVTQSDGAAQVFGLDLSSGALDYSIAGEDPVSGQPTLSETSVEDVVFAGDLAMPETLSLSSVDSPADVAALLRDGLAIRLEGRSGAQRGHETDPVSNVNVTYSALSSRQDFAINERALSTTGEIEGMAVVVEADDFPAGPVEFALGPTDFAIVLPGPAVKGAGDWTVSLRMADVVMGDGLWQLFDPEGLLDRGAAAMALDLGARLDWDLFAAIEAQAAGDTTPEPVPESLTVRELALTGLGVMARASGEFAFSPPGEGGVTDVIPSGSGDLEVTGLNRLIGALIELGALTRDDATGLRFGMAAFLKPAGEDRFTSRLEAKGDGQIIVNGARIR